MMFESGDTVLVSHRRMYESDEARFFLGRAIACEGPLVKIEGFTFVRDLSNGHIVKKPEKRIKVISLNSPGQLVYQLPDSVDVEMVEIDSRHGEAVLVDGYEKVMNLSEHSHGGRF